jgi:hypothetical protein
VNSAGDILLRMIQAHRRFAVFMALRNVPSLALIALFGVKSWLGVVLADSVAAVLIWWFVFQSRALRGSVQVLRPTFSLSLPREQFTLWLARLFQYLNSSLLRIAVPLAFAAHETGLFFAACIAQTPNSVFLSVGNQLFGHALARLRHGETREFLRIQAWFAAPNFLYVLLIAFIAPHWAELIGHVAGLGKYRSLGPLVLTVVVYSAVLSSDCQEFLLRTRGLSIILLRYNLCSIVAQIACFVAAYALHLSTAHTVILCAGALAANLIAFSVYSFFRVLFVPATAG